MFYSNSIEIAQGSSSSLPLSHCQSDPSNCAASCACCTLQSAPGKRGKGGSGVAHSLSLRTSRATMSCVVYCNIYWERTKLVMQSASEVAENVRETGEQLFPLTNKGSQCEQCHTHTHTPTHAHINATVIHEHPHTLTHTLIYAYA